MNQYEIEAIYHEHHRCPNKCRAVRLLYRLVQAVNTQSDGWAYWRAPKKAANSLMMLIKEKETITDDELKRAITPIKRMVTTQKRIQARYGNRFDFDVEQENQHE